MHIPLLAFSKTTDVLSSFRMGLGQFFPHSHPDPWIPLQLWGSGFLYQVAKSRWLGCQKLLFFISPAAQGVLLDLVIIESSLHGQGLPLR